MSARNQPGMKAKVRREQELLARRDAAGCCLSLCCPPLQGAPALIHLICPPCSPPQPPPPPPRASPTSTTSCPWPPYPNPHLSPPPGITYLTSTKVTAVNVAAKSLNTAAGETLAWTDALVLATGAEVRGSHTSVDQHTWARKHDGRQQTSHSTTEQFKVILRTILPSSIPGTFCSTSFPHTLCCTLPSPPPPSPPPPLASHLRPRLSACLTLAPQVLTWLVCTT